MQDLPNHLKPMVLGSKAVTDKGLPIAPPVQTKSFAELPQLSENDQATLDELLKSAESKTNSLPEPVGSSAPKLSQQELALVTHLETQYWLRGYPLWIDLLGKVPYDENVLRANVAAIQGSLESRGLPRFNAPSPKDEFPDWESEYDPEFVLAVNYITNVTDKRSKAAKLKALGVSPRKWEGYLAVEKNYLYFKMMVEHRWNRTEEQAKLALMGGVENGDLSTIKYWHEYTGKHIQQTQMTVNINHVMARLMDVLASEVDGQTLNRIADKMETIQVESRELSA